MFERLIEILFNNSRKDLQIRELEDRLEKAERAADVASRIVSSLHYAGSCDNAAWDYDPTRREDATLESMADEVIEAYGRKEMRDRAWPGFGRFDAEIECDPIIAEETPLPECEGGRKVVEGEWDPLEERWNTVLEPVILSPRCAIRCYCDGSGSIADPNGRLIAIWDVATLEAFVQTRSGMRCSLGKPYEGGTISMFSNLERLLDELESTVSTYYPDLTISCKAA